MKWIALIAGGILGTLARYVLSGVISNSFGTSFPYGTLTVNLIGCFLIGFFAALSGNKSWLNPEAALFLMTGFCGAFTTFSTFMLETSDLIKVGESFRAFLNIALSVILGFFVFRIGVLLAGKV